MSLNSCKPVFIHENQMLNIIKLVRPLSLLLSAAILLLRSQILCIVHLYRKTSQLQRRQRQGATIVQALRTGDETVWQWQHCDSPWFKSTALHLLPGKTSAVFSCLLYPFSNAEIGVVFILSTETAPIVNHQPLKLEAPRVRQRLLMSTVNHQHQNEWWNKMKL